jgi:hypothetical protein
MPLKEIWVLPVYLPYYVEVTYSNKIYILYHVGYQLFL